jgi:hypothetical protein
LAALGNDRPPWAGRKKTVAEATVQSDETIPLGDSLVSFFALAGVQPHQEEPLPILSCLMREGLPKLQNESHKLSHMPKSRFRL